MDRLVLLVFSSYSLSGGCFSELFMMVDLDFAQGLYNCTDGIRFCGCIGGEWRLWMFCMARREMYRKKASRCGSRSGYRYGVQRFPWKAISKYVIVVHQHLQSLRAEMNVQVFAPNSNCRSSGQFSVYMLRCYFFGFVLLFCIRLPTRYHAFSTPFSTLLQKLGLFFVKPSFKLPSRSPLKSSTQRPLNEGQRTKI